MALTTWAGDRVRKGDVGISKNCLNADEMDLLNPLTTMFLDFAELRARDRQKITMAEWVTQIDRFLTFNECVPRRTGFNPQPSRRTAGTTLAGPASTSDRMFQSTAVPEDGWNNHVLTAPPASCGFNPQPPGQPHI
jgi:Virulence protein RhuM family